MQEIINEGWVKLHRKILKSDMWKALTAMQRDLVITVMLKANHKPNRWEWKGEVYTCQAGEFVTSLDSLKKTCAKGTSIKMVRTGLKKLEKWEFLAHEGAKTGSKICIINWATYQTLETLEGIEEGKIGADKGQEEGKIGATNKNVKNEKNDKEVKHIYGKYKKVRLTDKQLETLKTEFPNDWNSWITRVDNYIETTGNKPYSNNLQAIRNWAKKDALKNKGSVNDKDYGDSGEDGTKF